MRWVKRVGSRISDPNFQKWIYLEDFFEKQLIFIKLKEINS